MTSANLESVHVSIWNSDIRQSVDSSFTVPNWRTVKMARSRKRTSLVWFAHDAGRMANTRFYHDLKAKNFMLENVHHKIEKQTPIGNCLLRSEERN
jgi:hypothetical protein